MEKVFDPDIVLLKDTVLVKVTFGEALPVLVLELVIVQEFVFEIVTLLVLVIVFVTLLVLVIVFVIVFEGVVITEGLCNTELYGVSTTPW